MQTHRAALPDAFFEQCRALGQPFSGNAAGKASVDDLEGLPRGPRPQVLGWRPRGIGAMFGCVLSAVLGMLAVVWYARGGYASEAEMEREVREKSAARERFLRVFRRKG
jgi:iron transport multicopper oxidase